MKASKYPLHPNGGRAAIEHWKKHRPKMYAELVRTGELEKAAYDAQEKTVEALAQLISRGMPYHMAWESVRENWIYLPDERTQPNLGVTTKPADGDLETSDYWGIDEEE